MTEELITVVVPIYNTAAYLDRCLHGIAHQTYQNLEIILVDDGSTDTSPAICEAWAARDRRIRVIRQENAGAGMARNTGIDHATGAYICFCDSDDYLAPDAVQHAYELAKREAAEIVVFGFTRMEHDRAVSQKIPQGASRVYRKEQVQSTFLADLLAQREDSAIKQLQMSPCTALFSMELIRRAHWRFVSEREIISEDVYSLLALYRHVESVAVLSEALYFYCLNPASLTKTYRKDRFLQIKAFFERAEALCDEIGYPLAVKERLKEPFLSFTIDAMKQEAACSPRGEAVSNIQKMVDDSLLQRVVAECAGQTRGIMRRILFWAIGRKSGRLCRLLAMLRNRMTMCNREKRKP